MINLGDSDDRVWLDSRKEQIMNSNYEWQKHQANEQVQLRDAKLHRLSKQGEFKRQQLVSNQKHYRRVIRFVQAKRQAVLAKSVGLFR